jgi:TonB family protein
VKLSCDGLTLAGEASSVLGVASVYDPPEAAREGLSPAGDVWSLGMTLVEVLTQKLPVLEAGRKEPVLPRSVTPTLAEVIRHCLQLDPRQRWTVEQIKARLAPARVPAPPAAEARSKPGPVKKSYAAAIVAIVILAGIVIGGWAYRHGRPKAAPVAQSQTRPAAAGEGAEPVQAPSKAAAPEPAAKPSSRSAVVREILPKVPKSARDTIHGTIRVKVRVVLDEAGNVAHTSFDSSGPSRYFARQAQQAAVGWKFAPPQAQGPNTAKEWLLQFQFRRNSTHVIPTPVAD